jgi:hypothetical protein
MNDLSLTQISCRDNPSERLVLGGCVTSLLALNCLDEQHPRGRHKARVFASALGVTKREAELLQRALMNAAAQGDAAAAENNAYGRRYVIDFEITGPTGRATITK